MYVAFPDSDWSRHTKPGALSAVALMGASCATNSAIFGSSSGAIRCPILICARWEFMVDPVSLLLRDASEVETVAQDAPPDEAAGGKGNRAPSGKSGGVD